MEAAEPTVEVELDTIWADLEPSGGPTRGSPRPPVALVCPHCHDCLPSPASRHDRRCRITSRLAAGTPADARLRRRCFSVWLISHSVRRSELAPTRVGAHFVEHGPG